MNALVRTVGAFTDSVSRLLERVEYVRIRTPDQHREIFRLRYEAYLKEGAILPNDQGVLSDEFDHSSNGLSFAVYVDGALASSMRLHVLSAAHPNSPAQHAFSDHLDEHVRAGRTIVDPNRFAADYARARFYPQLPYATVRLAMMLADHVGADLLTCTVRPEHRAFYKREFLAASVCEPRFYPTLIKPLGLMLIDFRRDREAIFGRHGFYSSTVSERNALFGPASLETKSSELSSAPRIAEAREA